jgi:hypothetical protein
MEVDKIMRTLLTLGANCNVLIICPLPCLRGVLEFARSVSNVLIICPLPSLRGVLEQNNENIINTRDKLEHSTKTWKCTQ